MASVKERDFTHEDLEVTPNLLKTIRMPKLKKLTNDMLPASIYSSSLEKTVPLHQ